MSSNTYIRLEIHLLELGNYLNRHDPYLQCQLKQERCVK